jgi:hypothetical protein
VIILFTDGVPNMISAYVNSPDARGVTMSTTGYPVPNVPAPGNMLNPAPVPYSTTISAGKSVCKYNVSNVYNSHTNPSGVTAAQVAAQPMIGVIGSGSAPATNFTNNLGLVQMAGLDTSYSGGSGSSAWSLHWLPNDEMSGTALIGVYNRNQTPITNCNELSYRTHNNPDLWANGKPDLDGIPPWDLYGNPTTPLGGVTQGHTTSSASSFPKNTAYTGDIGTASDSANGQQLNIAGWNAVDQAGWRIRSNATMNVIVYTIGFSGNGGTDDVLLARVANDPLQRTQYGSKNSTEWTSTQRQGQYFPASDKNAIASAFAKIAGMLLNLTR